MTSFFLFYSILFIRKYTVLKFVNNVHDFASLTFSNNHGTWSPWTPCVSQTGSSIIC